MNVPPTPPAYPLLQTGKIPPSNWENTSFKLGKPSFKLGKYPRPKKCHKPSNGAGFRPFAASPISIYKRDTLKSISISIYSGRKGADADPLRGVVALAILRMEEPIEGRLSKSQTAATERNAEQPRGDERQGIRKALSLPAESKTEERRARNRRPRPTKTAQPSRQNPRGHLREPAAGERRPARADLRHPRARSATAA